MSTTIERPKTVPVRSDTGEHDMFAHYADKNKIMESAMSGTPIRALCGKMWVPTRDPQKFPVCPTCVEIYNKLPK